jgi:hypothetical protein
VSSALLLPLLLLSLFAMAAMSNEWDRDFTPTTFSLVPGPDALVRFEAVWSWFGLLSGGNVLLGDAAHGAKDLYGPGWWA